ncbi:MAG: glutamate racemase [Flavobacteriales bacterium]|jgi:glutamate racemase
MPAKITIFDSGAGGLTIAKQFLDLNTPINLIYLADTGSFPYGELEASILKERLCSLIDRHISKYNPDLIIIACNTASTIALDDLRQRFSVPFIGVVPAIKPASLLSKTGHIALLATTATVHRQYTNDLILSFAPQKTVHKLASPELVGICEHYVRDGSFSQERLGVVLDGLLSSLNKVDVLVLACTHFPLLKQAIESHLSGRSISVIDSGEAIVRRAIDILGLNSKLQLDRFITHQITILSSDTRIDSSYRYYLSS